MSDTAIIFTAWVTAVGTAGLAFVGALTLKQGRKVIEAAIAEAKASNELVTETRTDRDLQWQPVPSISWPRNVVGSIGDADIHIANSGGGPAISMRYVGIKNPLSIGFISKSIDVPAGQFVELKANLPISLDVCVTLLTWTDDEGFNHNAESIGAIFTKDVLGNRYRFLVVNDRYSQPIIERSERWHPAESVGPSWTRSRDIWPDYGIVQPN